MVQKQSGKSSNKMAKLLRDRRYKQRVIKSKKNYNRKKYNNDWSVVI